MENTVYWIGGDGNVWFKDGSGVRNVGKPIKNYDGNGFDSEFISAESRQIDDPNQQTTQTSAPSGGGGAGPNKVLNQAAINNTNKAIGSLDTDLNVGYKNIDDNYNDLIGGYNRERTRTEGDYTEGKTTNTQNLQKNKQNSLVNAAQGLRGLRGVLGSVGALSGDGQTLANRAVTSEANADIGGATDTYAGNAQNLDKAWDRFDEEDDERRATASTSRGNQRTALQGSVAADRQEFYQKLAELYGEVDDTGNAEKWLNKAGDLNESISQGRRVKATDFSRGKAAFTPGDLESYLAGAGDMRVEVRDGGVAGGGPNAVLQGEEAEDERRRKLAVI